MTIIQNMDKQKTAAEAFVFYKEIVLNSVDQMKSENKSFLRFRRMIMEEIKEQFGEVEGVLMMNGNGDK